MYSWSSAVPVVDVACRAERLYILSSNPSASSTPLIRKGWLQQWRSCIARLLNEGPCTPAEPWSSSVRVLMSLTAHVGHGAKIPSIDVVVEKLVGRAQPS